MFFITSDYLAQTKASNVDFCDIYNSVEDYNEKLVRTKVILLYTLGTRVDGGDNYFYSTRCNNKDFFALADLTNLERSDFWEREFKRTSVEKKENLLQVTLIGKFTNSSILPKFGHLNWLRSKLEVIEIESIKNVTSKIESPNTKVKSSNSEIGLKLISANEVIMRYLFGIESNFKEIDRLIADNFMITDSKDTSINKEDFLSRFTVLRPIKFIHKVENVTKEENGWKVEGVITILSGKSETQTLNYENEFRNFNGGFKLTNTKISGVY
jgi:hypothetical protein